MVSLLAAFLWWLLERCSAVLVGAPLDPVQIIHRALVILTLGYLTGVGTLSYLQARWLRSVTGRRSLQGRPAPGAPWTSRFRPQQGNVVLVAALLGVVIACAVHLAFRVEPRLVEDGATPGLVALGGPLLAGAVTLMLRHTTAAGLGVLLGAVLTDAGNSIAGLVGAENWSGTISLGIVGSGLAGWILGLFVMRLSGRIGGSAVVTVVRGRLQEDRLLARLIDHHALAVEHSPLRLRPREPRVVQHAGTVWATRGDSSVPVREPLTVRLSATYSPCAHESVGILAPSLTPGLQPQPLLPRTTVPADHAQALVAGSLQWRTDRPLGEWTVVRDHGWLAKPVGEIVDNFLTIRAEVRTDATWTSPEVAVLVTREVTSTKQYTTPEVEALAAEVAAALTADGFEIGQYRVFGAASLHDPAPAPHDVAPAEGVAARGAELDELRASSVRDVFTRTLGAVLAVIGLTPIFSWILDRV